MHSKEVESLRRECDTVNDLRLAAETALKVSNYCAPGLCLSALSFSTLLTLIFQWQEVQSREREVVADLRHQLVVVEGKCADLQAETKLKTFEAQRLQVSPDLVVTHLADKSVFLACLLYSPC